MGFRIVSVNVLKRYDDLAPDDMVLEICPEFIRNLQVPAAGAKVYIRFVAAVEIGAAGDT